MTTEYGQKEIRQIIKVHPYSQAHCQSQRKTKLLKKISFPRLKK